MGAGVLTSKILGMPLERITQSLAGVSMLNKTRSQKAACLRHFISFLCVVVAGAILRDEFQ